MRHEQAAGHMADGYSRSRQNGRGVSHLWSRCDKYCNIIANSVYGLIPMVIFLGQVPSHLIGEDAFQETDMIGRFPVHCKT